MLLLLTVLAASWRLLRYYESYEVAYAALTAYKKVLVSNMVMTSPTTGVINSLPGNLLLK